MCLTLLASNFFPRQHQFLLITDNAIKHRGIAVLTSKQVLTVLDTTGRRRVKKAVVCVAVTIRFHDSYNIVLGSDGYLYILSHFGCLPNASLDWPV